MFIVITFTGILGYTNTQEGPMYTYYGLCRNSKTPVPYREQIIRYARSHGIKTAARKFRTTSEDGAEMDAPV